MAASGHDDGRVMLCQAWLSRQQRTGAVTESLSSAGRKRRWWCTACPAAAAAASEQCQAQGVIGGCKQSKACLCS